MPDGTRAFEEGPTLRLQPRYPYARVSATIGGPGTLARGNRASPAGGNPRRHPAQLDADLFLAEADQ